MRYQRIKELCKVNGITITGLEKELGFAKGSLSKIDKHIPSADKINKLAEKLNTTPEYILYGELNVHKSASGKEYYFDDQTAELAQKLHDNPEMNMFMSATQRITPEQFRLIMETVKQFLKEKESD